MIKSRSLFTIITAHKTIALVAFVVTVVLMNLVAFVLVKPYYSSDVAMIATGQQKTNDVATKNIKTYQSFVKTPLVITPIYKDVVDRFDYSGTKTDLKDSIDIAADEDSRIFTITATGHSASEVKYVASRTAQILQTETGKLESSENIERLTTGHTVAHVHRLNRWIVITLSVLCGILVAILMAIWREFANSHVTKQELQSMSDLPLLGVIKLDK
jgi:capsular polysaccharide biosynthesis protein